MDSKWGESKGGKNELLPLTRRSIVPGARTSEELVYAPVLNQNCQRNVLFFIVVLFKKFGGD